MTPEQSVVYDRAYRELWNKHKHDKRFKVPGGEGRLDTHCRIEALQAARDFVSAPLTPAEVQVEAIMERPTFKAQPQPPITGVFDTVIPGENETNFRLLEHFVNTMRVRCVTIPILLVGPPGIGKTSTAQIIAEAIGRKLLPLSGSTMGSDLFGVVAGPLAEAHGGSPFSEVYKHRFNGMRVERVAPSTIFIDEAHLMSSQVQTAMLMAMEGDCTLPKKDGGYVDFQDVLFLAGTTDPSRKAHGEGLIKPLRDRFQEVPFVPYGIETLMKIVQHRFPTITDQEASLIVRTAKLRPRVSINIAKRAGDMPIMEFIHDFLGADERGLDRTDMKIMEVLGSQRKYKNPQKVDEAKRFLAMVAEGKGRATIKQIASAESLLGADEMKPLFLNALADKLNATEIDDIRARVHYLETLNLVMRTTSGIVLIK